MILVGSDEIPWARVHVREDRQFSSSHGGSSAATAAGCAACSAFLLALDYGEISRVAKMWTNASQKDAGSQIANSTQKVGASGAA